MADNYLITGYWGETHVTPENDRGINAAIFGTGRFVLPVGEQFKAEYIGNNTIRMYDGKLMNNGAAAGIPAGRYVDLLIPEAGQGMKRNDLIVFQYSKDASTLVESGIFTVIKGVETSGTAEDPALTQENLLSDEATFDQMALWRVSVSATIISAPVQLFSVSKNMKTAGEHKVVATSTDGVNYTATIDGEESLYSGLGITIIPNKESASTEPTLNVNGWGAKSIRRRASNSTATTVASAKADWLGANKPIRVMYDGTYWIADFDRPNVNDLYGTVPVSKGGTGATDAATARSNLGITPANIGAAASSHNHSASNINSGTLSSDRLPTVPVTKGGTGATDAATARSNLDAAASSHNHAASAITSGTLSSDRLPTVPVAKGGTGATDAATARSNLGITPANIGAFPSANIVTFYNASLTVTNGVGTYTNSNIKSSSRCFCQRRVGSYQSGMQMVAGTTSNSGSVTIAFDTNFSSTVNINLIVINS